MNPESRSASRCHPVQFLEPTKQTTSTSPSPPPLCSSVSSPALLPRLLLTNSGADNNDSESALKFESPGRRTSTLTTSDIRRENTQQHLWRLRPQPTISLDLNQTSQNHKTGPGGSSLLTEPLQNQNQNLPGTRFPAWTNAARTGLFQHEVRVHPGVRVRVHPGVRRAQNIYVLIVSAGQTGKGMETFSK